jgi:hypothetical protein
VIAAHAAPERCDVYNFPGVVAPIEEVVAAIVDAVPGARVSWTGSSLPFPPSLEAVGFERDLGPLPHTTLADGIAATASQLRAVTR